MKKLSGIVTFIVYTMAVIMDTYTNTTGAGVPSAPPANFRLDSVGLSSITVTWERVPAGHRTAT
ncbi:hypothetical protein OS493_014782 [Desmophyllum pertusum]|uniref:Fibronectin type-III domain-containing protein n=1 Tax=Desmophyllum pertusum TaxID=174260 RepID=A0A9W9YD65_9CNID|nr:hypothetical protein OS493_014782 [Desmophyllum pertusum]